MVNLLFVDILLLLQPATTFFQFAFHDIHREAAFHRLVNVRQKLFKSVALRRAAGNRRDFRPIPAFFRFVDDSFEFHGRSVRDSAQQCNAHPIAIWAVVISKSSFVMFA